MSGIIFIIVYLRCMRITQGSSPSIIPNAEVSINVSQLVSVTLERVNVFQVPLGFENVMPKHLGSLFWVLIVFIG